MSYQQILAAQHRACDAEFVKIEQAVFRGDWAAAEHAVQKFIDDTETHFSFEEQSLFPALEAVVPSAAGPTSVMRSEHAQMRELFAELREAVTIGDEPALADTVETLLLLMQQHNMKEENVLYPIADRSLADDLLETLEGPGKGR